MKFRKEMVCLLYIGIVCISASAGSRLQHKNDMLRLPAIFSDNMVLQRGMKIPVWGEAAGGERVTVSFKGKAYTACADSRGDWMVRIDPCKAGGPYDMEVSTRNRKIKIEHILIGEVWLCSGQSNMVLDFNDKRLQALYAGEIASSANDNIREIIVGRTYAAYPARDFKTAGWIPASPGTLRPFSAAAYFFARALYKKYHVPIGIINACVGGTRAEAWTSKGGLASLPQFAKGIEALEDTVALKDKLDSQHAAFDQWNALAVKKAAAATRGQWTRTVVPGAATAAKPVNYGYYTLKKTVTVPASLLGPGSKCSLNLGVIYDADTTYINGYKAGHADYIGMDRAYAFPLSFIRPGNNTIEIRLLRYDHPDGFDPKARPVLSIGDSAIGLDGDWLCNDQRGLAAPRPGLYNPDELPTSLFNAMIAPLIPFAIKGVAWYQGEYNTDRAYEYRSLFPALIADWRSKWKQGDLPFIYQQLPNFQKAVSLPSENQWAELREAQLLTLDKLPNLGMAVGIDIGAADQLHPVDKKDVGERLALAAEKLAYHEPVTAFGPVYRSMEISHDSIYIRFRHTGGGLAARGGDSLRYFAIAGADRKFVWARAVIINDTLVAVCQKNISHPVAVRYAWAGNPDGCNLYNKAGLPASPFRTDDWPGLTFEKKYRLQ